MQKRLYVRGHAVDYTSLQCSRSAAPRGHGSRGIVPLREGKGFETLERPLDLPGVALSRQYDGILFEDLGNLLANELFSPDGAKQNSVKSILFGIRKLKENCKTLVVVSNEIFSDGEAYPPGNDGVHPDARGAARPHHAGGRCGFRERLWDFTADKRRF